MKSEYYTLGLQIEEDKFIFFDHEGSPVNSLERAFRYSDPKAADEARDIVDVGINQRYMRHLDVVNSGQISSIPPYFVFAYEKVTELGVHTIKVSTTVEEVSRDNRSETPQRSN